MNILEKVAVSTPEGYVKMSQEVFEEASWEERFRIDAMKEGREKLEASLRFARYCRECDEADTAYCYYASVLRKTVRDKRIISKYKDIAKAAYQGLISVQHCDDELTWESSSGLLEEYRELFEDSE